MTTLFSDVARSVHLLDSILNQVIQDFIDGKYFYDTPITVEQWRLNNYSELRQWAYPKPSELNDAQVKINSGISELVTEGEQQMEDYVNDCLNIKTRFPKE